MPETPPPGAPLTEDYRAAREAWIADNPLRSWRLSQTPKVTLSGAAELLGVGMSMIQMYERGLHKPSRDDRGAILEQLLGADWSQRWDDWKAARPTLTAPQEKK